MVLEGYGIRLVRLTEDKIELVRNWRNDQKISQYMEYKEYITPEMQKKWFDRINNNNNFFFIIEYKGREIGLINIKDINYEAGVGESGIFIYEDEYLNTDIPIRASFCLGDFIWNILKLNELHIHVLKTNMRAIKYNLFMGYLLAENQEKEINQLYILTKERREIVKDRVNRLKKILI